MTAPVGVLIVAVVAAVGLMTVFLAVKPKKFKAWELYYAATPFLSFLFMYETSTRPSFFGNLLVWFEYLIIFVSVGIGTRLIIIGIKFDVTRGKRLFGGIKKQKEDIKAYKEATRSDKNQRSPDE